MEGPEIQKKVMAMKYLDTHKLLELATKSVANGYNRQLDVDWVKEQVGENAYHVVTFAMYHDHIAGKPAPRHVRISISVMRPDDMLDQCQVDVSVDDYNSLPTLTREAISEEGWEQMSERSQLSIMESINDEPLDLEKIEMFGE